MFQNSKISSIPQKIYPRSKKKPKPDDFDVSWIEYYFRIPFQCKQMNLSFVSYYNEQELEILECKYSIGIILQTKQLFSNIFLIIVGV